MGMGDFCYYRMEFDMKLFIASDLHGSADYTSLMLERFRESGADRLVLLGDILYHGPRNDLPAGYAPKKVAPLLNDVADKIICVRGNCEAEVDSLMLEFSPQSDYGVIFDGERSLYLSHGHREVPKMPAGSLYFTGHTHIPHDFVSEAGVRCINPGSVSIPKNGTPHSAIVYEAGEVKWMNLESGEWYTLD